MFASGRTGLSPIRPNETSESELIGRGAGLRTSPDSAADDYDNRKRNWSIL